MDKDNKWEGVLNSKIGKYCCYEINPEKGTFHIDQLDLDKEEIIWNYDEVLARATKSLEDIETMEGDMILIPVESPYLNTPIFLDKYELSYIEKV